MHTVNYPVSFGDCDPAGIVHYPNIYSWFDRTFHDWLKRYGGHGPICKQFGAVGLGLFETSARFLHPMRDGDVVRMTMSIEDWSPKSVRLLYKTRVGDRITTEGIEVRGMFTLGDNGIAAANIEPLRHLLETSHHDR